MTGSPSLSEDHLAAYRGLDAVVLLPTLNEEQGLPVTLDDLSLPAIEAGGWRAKPLVLDGGSTDRTREIAASRGIAVVPQRSRGKGAAVREGLELLHELGVRYAVVLDADATYPGSAVLPALELLNSGSDLVIGVREPEVHRPHSFRDVVHRVGNVLLNFAAGQYSRSTYLDLTSGFWAVNVEKAHGLHLSTNDFGIEAELFLRAHRHGWNASQIPIVYRPRVGVAKLHAVPDGMRILLSIVRFGRRSLQAAPPSLSETPTILRDLLLTAFINGYHDVVLVSPPGLQPEAQEIAGRLRRVGLYPRIMVGTDASASPPAKPPDLPEPSIEGAQTLAGSESAVTVRFGPRGRLLYVKLTGGEPSPPGEGGDPIPGAARSGGYARRDARGRADFLDPLRAVGHRLDGDPAARRDRFLNANGIAVPETAESDVDSIPQRRIGTLFRGT